MGNIYDAFKLAFRDYATDGVPASGAHEPVKSEIRALGLSLETALAALTAGAADVIKTTRALLDADLAWAANSVGIVYADPTAANNDLYIKSGGSGAGSWTKTSVIGDAVEAHAQPYVDAAETAAENANATSPTVVIGPETPTPSAVSIDARTRVHGRPLDFVPTGPMTVEIAGGPTGGTVQIKRFSKSGDTFTQVGSDYAVVVGAQGTVTDETGIIPEEGEYLGIYSGAGVVAAQSISNTPGEALTYSSSSGTNVSSFTRDAATLSQFSAKFIVPRGVAGRLEELEEQLESLTAAATTKVVLGPKKPVPSDGATSSRVRIYPVPIRGTPITTLKVQVAGGLNGGIVSIKRFTKSGDVFTQVGEGFPVFVAAEGVTELLDLGVIPSAGEYVGCFSGTGGIALGEAPFPTRYEDTSGTNVRTFTAAATTGTTAPQIRIEYGIAPLEDAEIVLGGWTGWPVGGQSLGLGAEGQPALSLTQPYENLTFENGPKSIDAGDIDASQPLAENDLDEGAVAGTTHGETVCSSMANHAVRLAAVHLGYTPEDFVIFSFTAAHAGASIEELKKGTAYFTRLTDQVTAMKALADAENKRLVVPALTFIQGTSNQSDTELEYRILLEQYQVEVETAIQAITGQTSPVHLILSQEGDLGSSMVGGVGLAQLHASLESDVIHCVTPTYHIGRSADGTHMINTQYVELGHYFGRGGYELFVAKEEPAALYPVSCTAEGTTAWIKFHVPTKPLAIDTTDLPATTDNGVKISDDTGTLTLSGMTVLADGETLQITLNRALGANPVCRVGMDYLAAGLGSIDHGASTNFRDSTEYSYTLDGDTVEMPHVSLFNQMAITVLAEAA